MKNILVLAYTDLKRDPRPYRQIEKLRSEYNVYSMGTSESGIEKHFIQLKKMSFYIDTFRIILIKLGLYNKYYWDKEKKKALLRVNNVTFDLVIAHEIRLVPLALEIAKGAPVFLDAHEYSPKNFDDNFLWRFFIKKYYTYLCNKYIPLVNELITVSPGIVDEYKKVFNVNPVLIVNSSEYFELSPSKIGNKIKIIHHGIASSSRRLELMIEMMKYLDNNYELYLMLVYTKYSESYYKKLKKLADNDSRIKFLDPVKREDLVKYSNNFEIGIVFCPPTNFNIRHGLPNKFFEYIQSRLVVAIGPDIEMSKYIRQNGIGVIANDWQPKSMAHAILNKSKEDLIEIKNKVNASAFTLSSVPQMEILSNLVKKYLSNK